LSPRRVPAEAGDTTANRIWPVAAQMFRRKGYHASTTRELAEELGITRASLYYHVKKKEDLLYGICVESLRRVSTAVDEALVDVDDPIERIRTLVRCHVVSMLTDIDMHATMLLDLHQLTGDQLAEVVKLRDAYQETVDAVVAEARAAGALRSDITDKNATLALLNLMNWTITWYRPEGRLQPEEFATVIADIYLDGARKQR
jgi:TetR/AcrR family transcriptional regulator, cholesterol catabolism regulator